MIPAIIPTTVVTGMESLMKEVLECIWDMEDADIGILIPATINIATTEVIILVMMVEVDIYHKIPATITLKILEFIILVLVVEMELGLNRPSTLPPTIAEKDLMLKGEVDICLRLATLPRASQEAVVDFKVSNFIIILQMKMFVNTREVHTVVMDMRRVI